jgi:hypothetical protein
MYRVFDISFGLPLQRLNLTVFGAWCPCNLNTVNIIHGMHFVKLYFAERVDFCGFGAIRAEKG